MIRTKLRLELPKPFSEYDFVELTAKGEGKTSGGFHFQTIWLDVDKVRELTIEEGQGWVEDVHLWDNEIYRNFWNPLASDRENYMPVITTRVGRPKLSKRQILAARIMIRLGLGKFLDNNWFEEKEFMYFAEGRHRTEFFRSRGVKRMPFETLEFNVEILKRICT